MGLVILSGDNMTSWRFLSIRHGFWMMSDLPMSEDTTTKSQINVEKRAVFNMPHKNAVFRYTLQGTNISPKNGIFEDDFPFPKVGYVIVPWRVCVLKGAACYNHRPRFIAIGIHPSHGLTFADRLTLTYSGLLLPLDRSAAGFLL